MCWPASFHYRLKLRRLPHWLVQQLRTGSDVHKENVCCGDWVGQHIPASKVPFPLALPTANICSPAASPTHSQPHLSAPKSRLGMQWQQCPKHNRQIGQETYLCHLFVGGWERMCLCLIWSPGHFGKSWLCTLDHWVLQDGTWLSTIPQCFSFKDNFCRGLWSC